MPTSGKATGLYLLALAKSRSGSSAEADAALQAAEALAGTLPKPGEDDLEPGGDWPENWLICQILRREALQTLRKPTHAGKPKPASG
jgi:hypothetical protein